MLKNKITRYIPYIITAIIIMVLFVVIYKKLNTIDVVNTVDTIESTELDNAANQEPPVGSIDEASKPKVVEKKTYSLDKEIKNAVTIPKKILTLAVTAYKAAEEKDLVDNPKLTIIDYSQPSNKKRMWVIDMNKKKVNLNTYVSHGVRSGGAIATNFSNRPESHQSSIGVMKTGKTYIGKKGKSLYLHGLEKNINDNVYKRHVVIHGASYVNDRSAKKRGQVGKSFGCPAVDTKIVKTLINEIQGGSIVFAYYPNNSWINNSQFL